MLEYKGQAVLLLAQINKRAKQLKHYEDTQKDLLPSAVSEFIPEMVVWCSDVYWYWKKHKDFQLASEIDLICGVDFLEAHLEELSEKLVRKQYSQLSKCITILGKLKSESKRFLKNEARENRGNIKLTKELNELKAKPLLLKATRAGFLNSQYQPLPGLSKIQIKALAYAIGVRLNLPDRKRWVFFEKQWNLPHLKTTAMPFGATKELEAITAYYSDVDFSGLFSPNKECRFTSPFSARRIKTMFRSLVDLGYIDQETSETQFLGAFGRDNLAEPINWTKELRALAYFVYITLGNTNKDIWVATGSCFTVNHERINRASLKTALSAIKVKDSMNDYAPDIKAIAEQYNRPVRTQKTDISDSLNNNF